MVAPRPKEAPKAQENPDNRKPDPNMEQLGQAVDTDALFEEGSEAANRVERLAILDNTSDAIKSGNFERIVETVKILASSRRMNEMQYVLNALVTLSKKSTGEEYKGILSALKQIRSDATGEGHYNAASDAYAAALELN